ncbi:Uncharacterised protein [Mycobacteroides abscessus subsp. abscessus]|nr:Uncharacterised protein [Mycobacteroides abscessus subsp. abscessus]
MKSSSSPGRSSGPWMSFGSALATWELKPANSLVKIPNGVRSCSGSPPVEPWNVPGMRSAARLRIAAGVKS